MLLVAVYRPDQAIRVGTASVSQVLCEEVFVAGLDPQRVFAEEVAPKAGLRLLSRHLRFDVDRARQRVETTWHGHFASTSRYRPGAGCQAVISTAADPAVTPAQPPARPMAVVAPANAALRDALDRAFSEPARPPYRRVRAIVSRTMAGSSPNATRPAWDLALRCPATR